jgi:hypothetical protein
MLCQGKINYFVETSQLYDIFLSTVPTAITNSSLHRNLLTIQKGIY